MDEQRKKNKKRDPLFSVAVLDISGKFFYFYIYFGKGWMQVNQWGLKISSYPSAGVQGCQE